MTAAIPATTPTRRYKRRSQRRSSSRLIGGGTVLACSRKLGFLTQTWSEGLNGILVVLLHLRPPLNQREHTTFSHRSMLRRVIIHCEPSSLG